METLSTVTEEVRGFGSRAAQVGEHLHLATRAAGAVDPAALAVVFGQVGAEFAAAYTAAHGQYTAALCSLATTADAAGCAAHGAAAGYDGADAAGAAALTGQVLA